MFESSSSSWLPWNKVLIDGDLMENSRPLTHAIAGGVAGVGMVNAKLLAAIEQLQVMQAEPA